MKKLTLSFICLLIIYAVGNLVYKEYLQKKTSSTQTANLIGGQKDEHGCLIPAGYSWCETKQKCLRSWEEPCENTPAVDYSSWFTYTNSKFGFEIKFPKTWEGYKVSESEFPEYSYVAFSFQSPHQPFSMIQIIKRTLSQWKKLGKPYDDPSVLYVSGDSVLTCEMCCGTDNNFTGGGQFDEFQIARCKEGAEIIKTFKIL